MSKVFAIGHFESQNWEVIFDEISPHYAELFIGFTGNTSVVEFSDLKFKYELKHVGVIEQYGTYPLPNVRYDATDQEHIEVERIYLRPDQTYELYLWAENRGESFETTVSFTAARLEQPYPSWVWEENQWNPPVDYPENGEHYRWDETTKSWLKSVVQSETDAE